MKSSVCREQRTCWIQAYCYMPKLVVGGAEWRAVELPGNVALDSNFEFLSVFEELVPSASEKNTQKEVRGSQFML